jgi:hypothetical protein
VSSFSRMTTSLSYTTRCMVFYTTSHASGVPTEKSLWKYAFGGIYSEKASSLQRGDWRII